MPNEAPHSDPVIAKGLKEIWHGLNQAIADISAANYGIAKDTIFEQVKRITKAVEYFGGSVV